MNPEYHKVKLELFLYEVEQANETSADFDTLKSRIAFLVKKHKTTLAFSQNPCSVTSVPEHIHE